MEEFITVYPEITDAEILEKLEILKLERGISVGSFIVKSIAEKLVREGYLEKVNHHIRKEKVKEVSIAESLRMIDFKSMRPPYK